jgi:caa(3)-type oxidase subunit IV
MSDSHDHPKEIKPGSEPAHAAHDAHDMHLGLYWGVGGFLFAATALTVWLSYVDFGSRKANFVIAMIVATIKVGFVGAIFMHLKGEKWTIWKFLLFTVFFCCGLFFLTLLHTSDPIHGTTHSIH